MTEVSQKHTVSTLIGLVGGTVGMFTGFSVRTLPSHRPTPSRRDAPPTNMPSLHPHHPQVLTGVEVTEFFIIFLVLGALKIAASLRGKRHRGGDAGGDAGAGAAGGASTSTTNVVDVEGAGKNRAAAEYEKGTKMRTRVAMA